ncbi:hypothetical protein RJ640_021190 [Escallonia rubra]|uniref:F-box protein n=1 Tax=Escallonia rubra TaxID=112253 RepID=A0AA88S2P8_9ASTE|nr:hypothetical protein RJ640_021190 [Escallonia rubra]
MAAPETATIHTDIIDTHILPRLDGETLASAACASSQLYSLCTQDKLWMNVCNSKWPSTHHPRVRDAISAFPAGHRSFVSDSVPSILVPQKNHHPRPSQAPELISAVDIYYQSTAVYSRVEVTETQSESFARSPFWVELSDPKRTVTTPVKFEDDGDMFLSHLEEHMSLSWILIDQTRSRAVNLSSVRPVSVCRHRLADEVQLMYVTILAVDDGSSGFVECRVVVTCCGREGGELHVKEVSLQVQNMDGKSLSGREAVVILQEATESGRRKIGGSGEERERYGEFLAMQRERKEGKSRKERRLDSLSYATWLFMFVTLMVVLGGVRENGKGLGLLDEGKWVFNGYVREWKDGERVAVSEK